jgi:hypothetical protein
MGVALDIVAPRSREWRHRLDRPRRWGVAACCDRTALDNWFKLFAARGGIRGVVLLPLSDLPGVPRPRTGLCVSRAMRNVPEWVPAAQVATGQKPRKRFGTTFPQGGPT